MGGREFSSSVLWFLRNYPLSFSEVYVFEAWPGRFRIPPLSHLPEQVSLHRRRTLVAYIPCVCTSNTPVSGLQHQGGTRGVPVVYRLLSVPWQDLVPTMDNRSRVAGWGNLTLPDWALERIHLREEFVSIEDKVKTTRRVSGACCCASLVFGAPVRWAPIPMLLPSLQSQGRR